MSINERIFTEAIERHERDIKFASEEWSDKIDAELLALFTALDAMDEPVKAAVIAESIQSEFNCFPPAYMEPLFLSEEAAEVLRCINKFNAAYHEGIK